jgi:hypothetical protein
VYFVVLFVDSVAYGLLPFAENKWKKNAIAPMKIDRICDVDNEYEDPQLCATLASDIYMHLREAEVIHSFLNSGAEKVSLKHRT